MALQLVAFAQLHQLGCGGTAPAGKSCYAMGNQPLTN
jgi:hypothetical protein